MGLVDYDLNEGNLVKQESMTITTKGVKYPIMNGREFKIEYRLHKDDFPDFKDPAAKHITLFCLHVPQINMTYVDKTEESVFEALEECFEEDFIIFFATKLNEERDTDGRK